jgi:hypothetical protein
LEKNVREEQRSLFKKKKPMLMILDGRNEEKGKP